MCIARLSLAPLVLTTLIFTAPTLASDGEGSIAEAPVGWDVSAPNYSARAQEIALSVDQGTWMNLDVSPDGKRIAFDLLGDIYEIPIEGGEASPLLSGHAWEVQPQYSPDGRFLAFTSDRDGADNIWAMEIANPENKQQNQTHDTTCQKQDYSVATRHIQKNEKRKINAAPVVESQTS